MRRSRLCPRQIDKSNRNFGAVEVGGFNGLPNEVREIRRGKTTRCIPEMNGRSRIRLNRSNEFNVACSSRWIVEVLAQRKIGGVNALESVFCFEPLVLVAFKAIRVPKLGRSPIRLVKRRFRLRSVHDSESSGMLKTGFTDARHSLASLTPAAGNQDPCAIYRAVAGRRPVASSILRQYAREPLQ